MITLFYILGLILLILRLPILYRWKSIFDRSVYINNFKKVTKQKYILSAEKDLPIVITALLMGSTIIWSLIGLLSSNAIIFSLILDISIIISILHILLEKIINNYISSNVKLILSWLLIFSNSIIMLYLIIKQFG